MKQESIDSQKDTNQRQHLRNSYAGSRIGSTMIFVVGLKAGVIAIVSQLLLWWLAGAPFPEVLFQDVRFTAALVMRDPILLTSSEPEWDLFLLATLIHFALAVIYAALAAYQLERIRRVPVLVAGALYGLVIYAINLYGMTTLFPWIKLDRNWVTLLTHIVFGISLLMLMSSPTEMWCDE